MLHQQCARLTRPHRRERNMTEITTARRKAATARFMLRVIAQEQAHGIVRPDAEAFKARMVAQATMHQDDADCAPFLPPDDGAEIQTCPVCGVGHGDACATCGGRGFHTATCISQ